MRIGSFVAEIAIRDKERCDGVEKGEMILSLGPEEKFNFKKPLNKYEWSVSIGAGFILIAQIVKFIVIRGKQPLPNVQLFVFFFSLIGWSLLATALLLAGMQIAKLGNNFKKGRILVIAAGLLFLIQIASTVIYSNAMSYMIEAGTRMSREAGETVPKDLLRSDVSADTRHILSRSLAQIKYIQDGIIMDYFDESGARVVYKPTDEDISLRNGRVTMIRGLRYERVLTAYWCLLFITAGVVGLRRNKQLL